MLLAPLLEALQLILEWGRAALDWLLRLLWPSALVTLDGGRRVQVKKRLAEGGFAYVFLVTDAQTGEVCALKKILCQTREQLEAAKREILYHREFRHPNLLPLLDAAILQEPQQGATAIHAYLLFPFCTGGSLRDALNHRLGLDIGTPRTGSTPVPNPWPERQLLRLFRGVVLGVRELHQHKPALAHRDIKVCDFVWGRVCCYVHVHVCVYINVYLVRLWQLGACWCWWWGEDIDRFEW